MNILILHIPKTGGNSLQNYFSKLPNFNSYSIGHNINRYRIGAKVKLYENSKFVKYETIENLNDFFKITIVRNPYDQMVSFYHFELDTIKKLIQLYDIAIKTKNKKLNELDFKDRKQIFCSVFTDWQSTDDKIKKKTSSDVNVYKNKLIKYKNFNYWLQHNIKDYYYDFTQYTQKSDFVIKYENMQNDIKLLKKETKYR